MSANTVEKVLLHRNISEATPESTLEKNHSNEKNHMDVISNQEEGEVLLYILSRVFAAATFPLCLPAFLIEQRPDVLATTTSTKWEFLVTSVERHGSVLPNSKYTTELTQEKDHMGVTCVDTVFLQQHISKFTPESTLDKSHLNVTSVGQDLHSLVHLQFT
ncbi:hypothetical protein WMY93_020290 [Mugilogobius chulae]|uniref:Uncharacterized protein n=1 Tax=Mugilogobius chulae TaxID=88201 RepID=A0AAW0NLK4_9GOBI